MGADFGAAFDGDADRCGFIDNQGEIIPMDLFTALIAQDILSDGPATILYDLRSSRAVRECIEANGGKAIMSRVGHAFIKAQMRQYDAVFAGELSGHYYFKENFTAESQGLAMIKFANLICKSGKSASELVAPLRKYFASGEINSKVEDVKPILAAIKAKYTDGKMFELDGISVEYDNWWFNVRSSNTEPLLRLNVEARDAVGESSLVCAGKLGFSRCPDLLDSTSLATCGSATTTRGTGPNQRRHACFPCSRTFLQRSGATRGAMSWHRSGRGVDHASLFILPEVARQEAVRRATPRAPAAGNATTAGAADGRHATGASGPP